MSESWVPRQSTCSSSKFRVDSSSSRVTVTGFPADGDAATQANHRADLDPELMDVLRRPARSRASQRLSEDHLVLGPVASD